MSTAPLLVRGTSASPGFARGPLHVLEADARMRSGSNRGPQDEAAALRAALAQATDELAELIRQTADPDACAMLEFQVAMLEDDAITLPPFSAIEAGAPVDAAWRHALDQHIDEYRTAADAYFAARATDLQDMRDRVLRCLGGMSTAAIPAGAIVVGADLAPSRFLETEWDGGGIALFAGSAQSHLATLARARGVPMIVAMMSPARSLPLGDALLDADSGLLIAAPDGDAVRAFDARRKAARSAANFAAGFVAHAGSTADGERVRVLLNVAHIDDLAGISPDHCDGIGLVRTELMFEELADLRDEERQLERYVAILAWAQGRPVTFRTVDAGGDKPIEGYTLAGEANPFLGMRGIRLSLLYPQVLSTQLRALARAAAVGKVKIMLPMVTQPAELERVRGLLSAAIADTEARGLPCARPPLGMMVEVPAAALTIDTFAADFFSIGSNDLIAYTTAASRDSDRLAALGDPLQPAVLRLIAAIIQAADGSGREVSLCGDMAADPRCVPALLRAGLRSVSVPPAGLGRVKAAIAAFTATAVD